MLKKSFLKISFLFLLLSISSCTSLDEVEPFYVRLNVPNLINIEEQSVYHVGDQLYINVDFSRYLPEEGYTELLDVYKTTQTENFSFLFSFLKKNAYGGWSEIDVHNATLIYKGLKEGYGYASVLNTQTNEYELRLGIPLLETGEYKVKINNEMYPINNEGVSLTLYTSLLNSNGDTDGYNSNFDFVVE